MTDLVVAVDAMGGARAPDEIVAGAVQAVQETGVGVLLVGHEDVVSPLLASEALASEALASEALSGVEFLHASEAVAMDEDPAAAVRRKKDSSLVRCAEAVRDGRAVAMVSAGNTGAAMGAAVLRMGRIKGIARPAIALPIPVPGSTPTVLLDGGATVDCRPEWLVQFARMGSEYARIRFAVDAPRIGLLSNGEEAGKGDELRKAAHPLLAEVEGFIGNVEGRDVMTDAVDVVVTDGFTGNVLLKGFEGALRMMANLVFGVLSATDEAKQAAEVIMPGLLEAAGELDPESTGGAMLLGVDGVCVISHGSSSARAIVNAVRVASECVGAGIVERMRASAGTGRAAQGEGEGDRDAG